MEAILACILGMTVLIFLALIKDLASKKRLPEAMQIKIKHEKMNQKQVQCPVHLRPITCVCEPEKAQTPIAKNPEDAIFSE